MNSADKNYVSRGGDKLAGATVKLGLDFKDKIVLDVGSSTGGFTDYALKHGAAKVMAVEAGTNQLHPSLRDNPKVSLHEKTDIRSLRLQERIKNNELSIKNKSIHNSKFIILNSPPDIILVDVSFISLRRVLPAVAKLAHKETQIVALLKPQFEAAPKDLNKGVVKNDTLRRRILKDFELWVKNYFNIKAKADSEIAGTKGNLERFYLLSKV